MGTLKRPALWHAKMSSTRSSPGEQRRRTVSPLFCNGGESSREEMTSTVELSCW